MSYSNSVATWASGVSTSAGIKKGWRGSVWVAAVTTSSEPSADNADWTIDSPLKMEGVTIIPLHDPKDYLKLRIAGITMMETHISRPPMVQLQGLTLMKERAKPFLIIS